MEGRDGRLDRFFGRLAYVMGNVQGCIVNSPIDIPDTRQFHQRRDQVLNVLAVLLGEGVSRRHAQVHCIGAQNRSEFDVAHDGVGWEYGRPFCRQAALHRAVERPCQG